MNLLPEGEQAQTHVQVSNQTGVVGVLRANQTASGCYIVDLTTLAPASGPAEPADSCLGEIPSWATAVHGIAAPGGTYLLEASLASSTSLLTHSLSAPLLAHTHLQAGLYPTDEPRGKLLGAKKDQGMPQVQGWITVWYYNPLWATLGKQSE